MANITFGGEGLLLRSRWRRMIRWWRMILDLNPNGIKSRSREIRKSSMGDSKSQVCSWILRIGLEIVLSQKILGVLERVISLRGGGGRMILHKSRRVEEEVSVGMILIKGFLGGGGSCRAWRKL